MDGGGTYLYQRLTYQKPQDDGVHGRKIPRETNRSSEATLLDEFASVGTFWEILISQVCAGTQLRVECQQDDATQMLS